MKTPNPNTQANTSGNLKAAYQKTLQTLNFDLVFNNSISCVVRISKPSGERLYETLVTKNGEDILQWELDLKTWKKGLYLISCTFKENNKKTSTQSFNLVL